MGKKLEHGETLIGSEVVQVPSGKDAAENESYNKKLYDYVKSNPNTYMPFNIDDELTEINNKIKNAIDKNRPIDNKISEIEQRYKLDNLPDFGDVLNHRGIKGVLGGRMWAASVFNGLYNGERYDFSLRPLTLKKMAEYIYVEDEVEFYKQLLTLKSHHDNNEVESDSTYPQPNLTLSQIALIHIYEGRRIPRGDGANNIAKQYGHNSGDKLYNVFSQYTSTANRKGDPGSKQKLSNKIRLFKSVVGFLSPNNITKANDDILLLETAMEKYNL